MTYDERFYYNAETPKDLSVLKATYIFAAKDFANSLLSKTDWYVVRKAEHKTAIPTKIKERRAEIRQYVDTKESTINACDDVPSLATYVTSGDFSEWYPTDSEE